MTFPPFRPADSEVSECDPEALRVQIDLLRNAGTAGRVAALLDLSDEVHALSREALRRSRPGDSDLELDLALVALLHGDDLAREVGRRLREGR